MHRNRFSVPAIVPVLAAFLALPAGAQDLPAVFQVTGVAANDRLNIRAEPNARAAILDSIFPFAVAVEVLERSADGRWGLVGVPEGNGWVNMRYLTPVAQPDYEVPRPLSCYGTEPFWSLGFFPRGSEFHAMGEDRRPLTVLGEAVAPGGYLLVTEEGPTLNRTAIVTREWCSDGMSDRRFGWSVRLFTEAPDGNSVLSGCCTLDGR
jgi:uncharacterized membrane protein